MSLADAIIGGGGSSAVIKANAGATLAPGQAVKLNASGEFIVYNGSGVLFGVADKAVTSGNVAKITSTSQLGGAVLKFANIADLNGPSTNPDLTTLAYASKSFAQNNREVFFKFDGLVMYTLDSGKIIRSYNCSVAFDVTTAVATGHTLDPSAQEFQPHGLYISENGLKMYVCGTASDSVYQYNLSVAWDLSTASYASKSFAPALGDLHGVALSPSGTKLFIFSKTNRTCSEYNLSVAYELDSVSALIDTLTFPSGTIGNLEAGRFSADGTKIFVHGGTATGDIYQWNLPTAFDLTSGVYSGISGSINAQVGNSGTSLYCRPDGLGFYAGNSTAIYQYSTSLAAGSTPIDSGKYLYITSSGKITEVDTGNFLGFKATPTQLILTKEPA